MFSKEKGVRPDWQSDSTMNFTVKIYWLQWNSLIMQNDVFRRKWENLKFHVSQIIVSEDRISKILSEAHDSPFGGDFGNNKVQ